MHGQIFFSKIASFKERFHYWTLEIGHWKLFLLTQQAFNCGCILTRNQSCLANIAALLAAFIAQKMPAIRFMTRNFTAAGYFYSL
jgi:hypothetical protein